MQVVRRSAAPMKIAATDPVAESLKTGSAVRATGAAAAAAHGSLTWGGVNALAVTAEIMAANSCGWPSAARGREAATSGTNGMGDLQAGRRSRILREGPSVPEWVLVVTV